MQTFEELLEFAVALLKSEPNRHRGGDTDHDQVIAGILQRTNEAGYGTGDADVVESLTNELKEAMSAEAAGDADKDKRPAVRGTVRWYRQNADKPVSTTSTMTIRQASYCAMSLKLYSGMNNKGLDAWCAMMAGGGFLQQDNNMPRQVSPCAFDLSE